ncbi:MAG: hypothetical protein ABSH20_04215 [Tepidisphaeraceae bacterium]|jgi:competence protein ComEC
MGHVKTIILCSLFLFCLVSAGCDKGSDKHGAQPSTQSGAQPSAQSVEQSSDSVTVHVTRTGKKYHRAGCAYLSKSDIPITLDQAKAKGYTPCSKCNPPQ